MDSEVQYNDGDYCNTHAAIIVKTYFRVCA